MYSWAEDSVPWSCESRDEFERLTQNRKPSRRKDHLRTVEKEMSEGRHGLSWCQMGLQRGATRDFTVMGAERRTVAGPDVLTSRQRLCHTGHR